MCPWPEAATLGIQNPRGEAEFESNNVPYCLTEGVLFGNAISYQRAPLRPPVEEPVPELFTWIFWAVQSELEPVILLLWMAAAKHRLSSTSRFLPKVSPWWTWRSGGTIGATVT